MNLELESNASQGQINFQQFIICEKLASSPDEDYSDDDEDEDEDEEDDFDMNDPYSDDEKDQMGSSEFFKDND